MYRYLSYALFSISIFSCNQKIGKNSLPPETNSTIKQNSGTILDIQDTIQGRIKLNKDFNGSHFCQMIDGNTTILQATLHNYQPEGMKDGGERIRFYTQILNPKAIKKDISYPIDSELFRNRLEMIYDPGYDAYEQKDLVGKIKFIKIDTDIEYIYQLTIGEKGSEKLVAKKLIVQCK